MGVRVSDEMIVVAGNRFHLVWLRDNCQCPICQDSGTGQKLYDVTASTLTPQLLRSSVQDGSVHLVWDEEPPHESVYNLCWLERHAYDREAPPALEPAPAVRLWNANSWADTPPIARLPQEQCWKEELVRDGFALLKGLDRDDLQNLLDEIGPIQPTEFGPIAPLLARPDANDIGESGLPLNPHSDYTVYMGFPDVLGFLHCLRNDSDGGVSILVDAFAVAEHLREQEPAAFDLLVRTPLPFHQLYDRWRYHHYRLRPMIELDEQGKVCGVHVGTEHTRAWNLPFNAMIPTYNAYSCLMRLLNDPAWQLHHLLQQGQCFVYRNQRVLHGRTGFSSVSGTRHLQVAYVCWSYFAARQRYDSGLRAEVWQGTR